MQLSGKPSSPQTRTWPSPWPIVSVRFRSSLSRLFFSRKALRSAKYVASPLRDRPFVRQDSSLDSFALLTPHLGVYSLQPLPGCRLNSGSLTPCA